MSVPHSIPEQMLAARTAVAERYLHGFGVEIGGLHYPLPLPPGARGIQLDVSPTSLLTQRYADIAEHHVFVPTGIVADATAMPFAPASLDWIVACHVLEHLHEPLRAIQDHVQVVRPGGVLLYALPDMRRCFDRNRTPTTVDHLIEDEGQIARGGQNANRTAHYLEWAQVVMELPADEAARAAERMSAERTNIHYHAWDDVHLLQLLAHMIGAWKLPCWIEEYRRNDTEFLFVLRRVC